MQISRSGCFGKIPRQGDFVRHHAEPLTDTGFDRWLQDGLAMTACGGSETELRAFHFLLRRDQSALCGVAVPSHDRVGRRYPVLIFVALSGGAEFDCLLPVISAEFARAAQDIAEVAARGGHELPALKQYVDSLRWAPDESAAARLDSYLDATTMRAFAAPSAGDGDGAAVAAWFTNLALAVRGADRPRYAVRTACADDPLWVASCLRLAAAAAHRRTPRLVMWDIGTGAELPRLRGLYDDPSVRYAPGMIHGRLAHDLAFDVQARALPHTPPGTHGALMNPDTPLRALLSEWGSGSRGAP